MTDLPPFLSAAELERLDDPVIADVRWTLAGPKRDAYGAGHLPGAVFVDLDTALSAPASPERGRHPLPDPLEFAAAMGRLGIDGTRPVVAYDDEGGVHAARLVWLLRALGHPAAVLDGGIGAWPGPLSTDAPAPTPVRFAAAPWPAWLLAEIDEVAELAAEADSGTVVIDARPAERYRGDDGTDPRAGHIPGARSLPVREHLRDGALLGVDELRARFAAVGIEPGTPVVSYCGSGVTGCANLLVLEHAGLGVGRLYPGSWSQWAADPARPVETGDGAR
ncbi:MAG: sulfurtransferase [Microbacteriaceae bacterium]|nr:sulfurtransferase [Microbacteriaceae bacterium]